MRQKSTFSAIILVISLLAFGSTPVIATAPANTPLPRQTITVKSRPLQIVDGEGKRKIPAPQAFLRLDAVAASTPEDFIITFTGDWPEEAKTAFNYAASIWSALIDPAEKITINAHSDSGGYCSACSYIRLDYPDGVIAETLYPRTLNNHLSGYDVFPDNYDFEIYYGASYHDWYYGTDGSPAGFEVDFVTVILHEIGHGLGFIDTFFMDAINGWWGSLNNYPLIYDTFIVNGAGQSLIDTSIFPDYSPELKAQLEIDDLYFDGPMTRLANQGQRAKVEAFTDPHGDSPDTLSHLNENYYQDSANELMTTTLYPGESIHDPGLIVLGILADLGWTLSPNLPVFYPLPSQLMLTNTQRVNAIDLWGFIPAEQSPSTNFTFAITNSPTPGAGVSLHDNRYIDLVPSPGWLGNTQVAIKATNSHGLSANQTFNVYVVDEIHPIFLPAIVR